MFDEPVPPAAPPADPSGDTAPLSETQRRFTTCRWHKPPDASHPAHCTHREVLPMAGIHGFNPESWCPECRLYKLRRVPRKNAFA